MIERIHIKMKKTRKTKTLSQIRKNARKIKYKVKRAAKITVKVKLELKMMKM